MRIVGRVSAVRSRTMAAIKSKNTKPELALRRELTKVGLRFRLHKKGLPGSPDIVFSKVKIAVFCDGDFWHGRGWKKRIASGKRFGVRHDYWTQKIEGNIARDKRNNRELRKLGWVVLRFWESDIKKKGHKIARIIFLKVQEKKKTMMSEVRQCLGLKRANMVLRKKEKLYETSTNENRVENRTTLPRWI